MCGYLSTPCILQRTPFVCFAFDDPDGDNVTMDVEVVRSDDAVTGVPTHRSTDKTGLRWQCGGKMVEVLMTGLEPGQSYVFAVRIQDALGAPAVWDGGMTGWVTGSHWAFVQGPPSR
jgi:hypothetical protein